MLEDTFSKQFTFPNYIRQTFNLPKEEVKAMNTTLCSTFATAPQKPSCRNAGQQQTQTARPPLTDSVAFSSFESPAWGEWEPGSRSCLAPCRSPASSETGARGGQPRGKGKRLLLTSYSGLALTIKATGSPRRGTSQPPCLIAICSNRLCCGHEREGGWTWGRGQWAVNKSPQALREAFISGVPCDTRGSSTKCTSLKSRDHGVSQTWIC